MIELIPARPEMAFTMTPQRGQIATGQILTRDALADAIRSGYALACVDGARILSIGGIAEQWPDRGVLWGLVAEGIGATMTPIHRVVRRALETTTLKRVEAHIALEHPEAVRWIEMLGFTREGVMRSFWQGHDYALYSRVR